MSSVAGLNAAGYNFAQPKPNDTFLAGPELQHVMRGKLRSDVNRICRIGSAMDDTLVKRVLRERRPIHITKQARRIRLVFREQRRGLAFVGKLEFAKLLMLQMHKPIGFQAH